MSRPSARPNGRPRIVRLVIDSRLDHVALLGRAVRALCGTAGLASRDCAQVELALVEAVNNVIRHAYDGQAGHAVDVAFVAYEDRIAIEIVDEGAPMPDRRKASMEFDPADVANLPEGGMGLFIIHSVMDHVEFGRNEGRNTLRMTRRLAA